MSALSVVTTQGYMPISRAIATAYADAATLTQQLATTAAPLPPSVLAAAETASKLPTSATSQDPLLIQLQQAADVACFQQRDAAACSAASQKAAAYQAGASCANSTATAALLAKRDRGSVQDWFRGPTQVLAIKPTSNEVAAAAISLAAVRAFQ